MKLGSQGHDVEEVQAQLNKRGASLTVDGVFGKLTKQAVQTFQSANSPLKPDGIVGDLTRAALAGSAPGPVPPPPPDTTPRHVVATVTDAATGNPIGGAAVKVGDQSATTGADGKATLSLPPGQHPFGATAEGFQQAVGDVDVTADDETGMEIVLQPAGARPVVISPANPPALEPAGQQQFSAADAAGTDITGDVDWISSDPDIVAINAGGMAIAGSLAGAVTITALLRTVAVGSAPGPSPGVRLMVVVPPSNDVVKITVIPADAIAGAGILGIPETMRFKAIGETAAGKLRDVTKGVIWTATSSPPGVVVDAQGEAEFNGPATAVITATSRNGSNVAGSAKLTVFPAGKMPTLQSIAIEPARPQPLTSNPLQLRVIGTFSDGTLHEVTQDVKWESADPNTVAVDAGLATPGEVSGPATITATHKTANIRPASVTLTVVAPPPPPLVGLVKLTVASRFPLIPAKDTEQFTAMGEFSSSPPRDVTTKIRWSSSALKVASISQGGMALGKSPGTTTITATDPNNPKVSASNRLDVHPPGKPPTLSFIDVGPTGFQLTDFTPTQFTAKGQFSDGVSRDLTRLVLWSVVGPNVTISKDGLATAEFSGFVDIVAADVQTQITGSQPVTVSLPGATSITVDPPTATSPVGIGFQFGVVGTLSSGQSKPNYKAVVWAPSPQIATVDPTGLVVGLAIGQAKITATDPLTNANGSATITFTQPILVSIQVTVANSQIPPGQPVPVTATGTFSDGTAVDISAQVKWSSSSTDVSVDPTGLVVGQTSGTTAEITATDVSQPSINGAITVTVGP